MPKKPKKKKPKCPCCGGTNTRLWADSKKKYTCEDCVKTFVPSALPMTPPKREWNVVKKKKPKKKGKKPIPSAMKEVTDPTLNLMNPPGDVAAKNPNHSAVVQENNMENTMQIFEDLRAGRLPSKPCIIGSVNGKMILREVKLTPGKNGLGYIEDYYPKPDDLKKRKRMAEKIVDKLNPVLKRDIGRVAYIALTRKPLEKLKEIHRELKKDKKTKLTNRVGCIFLEVGDRTCQI